LYVASVALAALLILAAIGKFGAGHSLAAYLTALGLPERYAGLLDGVVPYIEIAFGIWLITGIAAMASAIAALLLTCGFASIHVVAAVTRTDTTCRCFGRADTEVLAIIALIRSLGMLALAALTVTLISVSAGVGTHERASVLAIGLLAAMSFHLSFLLWNEVVEMRRRDKKLAAAVAEAAREHAERHAVHVA
jgi:hypothetical protein